jgi:site-specific recombinase XerD
VAAYLTSVDQLVAFLAREGLPTDVRGVRTHHVRQWLADLAESRAPATVNKRYMAVRVFFA